MSIQPVILRCSALLALKKVIASGGRSMSDQAIKDTLKALRSGLSDKAGAIVRECAEVSLNFNLNIARIYKLISLLFLSLIVFTCPWFDYCCFYYIIRY